jgi:hypothetical protein
VGGADSLLHEIAWKSDVTENIMANQFRLQDVASIAGFFDLSVHSRDVIVAMKQGSMQGSIFDVHYSGGILTGGGSTTDKVTHFDPPPINVAAFVAPDTGYRHVIVLDSNGDLYDYSYKPQQQYKLTRLPKFTDVTNVADIVGYYSDYDHMRHVIVATRDRNIHEIYYDKLSSEPQ